MKKKKKQGILNFIIIIAVIAIFVLGISLAYKMVMEENQEPTISNVDNKKQEDKEEPKDKEDDEENKQQENEFLGQEEIESKNDEQQKDELSDEEKAIALAKKEWGEEDKEATYSIEEKKGNMYYIAVKSNATTLAWYEVNTQNWEINEYY